MRAHEPQCRARTGRERCIRLVYHHEGHQTLKGHTWYTPALIARLTPNPRAARLARVAAAKRCAEIALAYADENRDGRRRKDAHLAAWLNLSGKIIAERIRNEFGPVGAWPSIDRRLVDPR